MFFFNFLDMFQLYNTHIGLSGSRVLNAGNRIQSERRFADVFAWSSELIRVSRRRDGTRRTRATVVSIDYFFAFFVEYQCATSFNTTEFPLRSNKATPLNDVTYRVLQHQRFEFSGEHLRGFQRGFYFLKCATDKYALITRNEQNVQSSQESRTISRWCHVNVSGSNVRSKYLGHQK